MKGISLNQYISNYREIVLKLKGIDEFQVLRGFMRGLHPKKEPLSLRRKFFKINKGDIGMSGSLKGQEGHWKKKPHPRKPKN